MKVDLERPSQTAVKLSVSVPFEEMKPAFDKAYKRIAEQVNIPGFRKGKVPSRVIDQRFGRGVVIEEALNAALPDFYEQAMLEHNLVPVGRPNIDVTEIADESHIDFTVEVEIRPEFEIPSFDTLKVEVDAVEVDAASVDEQIDALRNRFATTTEVDRAAQNGDLLLVDISGELDGNDIADLSGSALSYELGTDGMLPGFDEAVAGAAKGETRTFEFTPEAGEHAGPEAAGFVRHDAQQLGRHPVRGQDVVAGGRLDAQEFILGRPGHHGLRHRQGGS